MFAPIVRLCRTLVVLGNQSLLAGVDEVLDPDGGRGHVGGGRHISFPALPLLPILQVGLGIK